MQICEENMCTGCAACYNICTKKAIHMKPDSKGFLHPEINEALCVDCGLCRKVCPVENRIEGHTHLNVYAALVKDDKERAKSTSGGVFACLAQNVLKKGGYVFGAVMDADLIIRHWEATDLEELDRVRGSKYVQSEIGDSFKNVRKRLQEGKQVLFSGTPCQIAGLRKYLGKEWDNLLTIDILCHGVPSPGIFQKYIKAEEFRAGEKMKDVIFRTKRIGWKKTCSVRVFASGKEADWPDTFVPGFLKDLYLRESCYSCQFANDCRQGDITLGDFWGYKESSPEYIEDDDRGISLVIVNTKKGEKALKLVRRKLALAPRTMEDAKQGNPVLYKPCDKPQSYNEFWQAAERMSWEELCELYIPCQDTSEWMNESDRIYYSKPYSQRHWRHLIHLGKLKIQRRFSK